MWFPMTECAPFNNEKKKEKDFVCVFFFVFANLCILIYRINEKQYVHIHALHNIFIRGRHRAEEKEREIAKKTWSKDSFEAVEKYFIWFCYAFNVLSTFHLIHYIYLCTHRQDMLIYLMLKS